MSSPQNTEETKNETVVIDEKLRLRRELQKTINRNRYKNDEEFRKKMNELSKQRYQKMKEGMMLLKKLQEVSLK